MDGWIVPSRDLDLGKMNKADLMLAFCFLSIIAKYINQE